MVKPVFKVSEQTLFEISLSQTFGKNSEKEVLCPLKKNENSYSVKVLMILKVFKAHYKDWWVWKQIFSQLFRGQLSVLTERPHWPLESHFSCIYTDMLEVYRSTVFQMFRFLTLSRITFWSHYVLQYRHVVVSINFKEIYWDFT